MVIILRQTCILLLLRGSTYHSNHTHQSTDFHLGLFQPANFVKKQAMNVGNGGLCVQGETVHYAKRTEMAFPVPGTKAFLQPSPDAVRLFTDPALSLANTEPISQGYCTISHKVLRLLSSVSNLSDLRSVSSVTGRPASYEQNEAY